MLKVSLPALTLFSVTTEHFHVPDTVYLHTRKEKEREAESQIAVDAACPPDVTSDGKVPSQTTGALLGSAGEGIK